ncbi:MAG: hypothetical protein E2O48_03675 [Gemmatimonadetes bacterium]|nr:MAG: hypothetical protein E2O48_03675 [Gemmatimonadota bacterium]
MISQDVYWYLHILGVGLLILSVGGVTLHAMSGGTKETSGGKAMAAASHGIGLVLILVAGFGMLARMGLMAGGLPGWAWAKVVIWLSIGLLFMVPYRKPEISKLVWFGTVGLMVTAAFLAHAKPF